MENSKAIDEDRRTYDYIIHDVFTGGAEPVELFTQEFLQGLSEMLNADGVIAIVGAFNEFRLFGAEINDFRITPAIFFVRQQAMLSGPSSPYFPHVDCSVRMPIRQVRPRMGVKNQQEISPTWSSSAGSRLAVSVSEGQKRLIFSVAMLEETISGRGMKSMQLTLTVVPMIRA